MKSTSDTHDNLLKKLLGAIPEIKFAALIDTNANLIAYGFSKDIEYNPQSIAISSVALHLSSQKLVNQLFLGDINFFHFKCSNGRFFIFPIDSERTLLVQTTGEVRYGLILLDCRRTIEKLQKMEYQIPERKVSLEKKLQEIKIERERIERNYKIKRKKKKRREKK